MRKLYGLSVLVGLLATLTAAIPAAAADGPTSRPTFIIGVWSPPARDLAAWKTRGANTAVGYESESNTVSMDQWIAAARRQGMFTIRRPHKDIADDLNDPSLLAFLQMDEPDQRGIDPEVLLDQYGDWKKRAPGIPVFLNVSGGHLLFRKTPRETYEQYFRAADWIGNDFYPVTGWNQPTWLPRIGQAIDLARELSDGKPQFAFIETSNQQLAWTPKNTRGVTPGELRAEIWQAIVHGAGGIIYFPQQFNPFQFDATPSDVSLEMVKQDALLEKLGPILSLPHDPKGMKVSVTPPLEAAWRKGADGICYAIVVNMSPEPLKAQTIKLSGFPEGFVRVLTEESRSIVTVDQAFTTDFSAFGAAVYRLEKVD
jgi:hypothetical protein